VGSVRIGVARSDPSGTLAVPVETVRRGKGDVAQIVRLAAEYEALEILVGHPLSMSGQPGKAAAIAVDFAEQLAAALPSLDIKLVDERLTTVQAQRGMQDSGVTTRQGRDRIDQAAAVIIVQHALEFERQNGEALGTTVRTP
jgi:putative Holliday junction resolvase